MENGTIRSELFFLIAKFLKNSPCEGTFKKLLEELDDHDLLPVRYDWSGEKKKQSFHELEGALQHVNDSHLLDICNRIFPLLHSEFKSNIKYEPSLLGDGNNSVLKLREQEKKSFSLKSYLVRRHGIPFPEPVTFRKHNIVKALYGREASGPFNRKHILAGCPYKNFQPLGLTQGHLSAVYCVLFDSSGKYIFTGADDLLVKVWHAISGRLLTTLRGASSEISDLAVNYENTLLAAGSMDKMVRVWCLQTAFPVATLPHPGTITGVNFCPAIVNGCRYLAVTATDSSVAFWKYVTNDTETSFEHKPTQFSEKMRPGNAQILCGSFSPGGMFLATGSGDHNVRVYKMAGLEAPERVLENEAHSDRVDSIQWAHTRLRFASGSKDGTCLIWYFEQQAWKTILLSMTTKLPGTKVTEEDAKLKLRVTMLDWDKSDQWVITACSDHSIKVWDSWTGQLIQVLHGHKDETYVVESHPLDSRILLSAGHDGKFFLWNIISGEILAAFQNQIDGQGCGALFDAKWSPDGASFAATDSHGRILIFGLGPPDVTRKVPFALFFHTDYRPLTRNLNNVVLDEQTQIPPHLMPPPFLVDMDGNPYPPYLQRLVPGREHCDLEQLVPNVVLSDEGQQEVIMEADENEFLMMGRDLGESRRPTSALRSRVGMRRTGDIEGVRQSSGNWQRGDNISWTKRLICEPLDKLRVNEIAQRVQYMASIEMAEYNREAKKPMAPEPALVPVPKRVPRRKKTHHSYRTRASRIEQLLMESENADLSSADSQDENDLTAHESSLGSASSSSENEASSDYSDWTADHGMNNLEPPQRVAHVRRIRRVKKITKIVGTTLKKPAPADVPEEYRPSEWLAETMPKKAPYYPQMGDEVMFFQQGYNLYLNAVKDKNIYLARQGQLSPWGKLKLKEPQLCKVIGIKYEIRPPRLCGLRLALMNEDNLPSRNRFDLKYHDITDVIDFLVLRQLYDTAMSRNWKVGDRFRSAIDDAWWCGRIVARNESAQSPFLCYKIRWDNNEDENLSPWDLEPLNSRREPQNGSSLPILPREMKNLLYHPEPDEWPGGDNDVACERILRGLEDLMSMAIAEHFLAPVDISMYPSYAYVVEYPIDLSTIKARFENRFYRRLAAAQFDARYIASNAEKFNERDSNIVKHARIITDILLKIMKATLTLDVPALCRQLQENYVSTDSTEEEANNSPGPSNRLRLRPATSKRNLRLTRGRTARGPREPFDWKVKCKELLQLLWMSEDSEPFRQPVDRLDHPDYDKIIDTPMDLSIIREELKGDNYDSPHEFWKDLKIMFNNAKNYTPNKRTRIYAMTVRLSSLAEEQMKTILSDYRTTGTNKKSDSPMETTSRRGLKRRRRAKDSSVGEESSDMDVSRPSTSTSIRGRPRRMVTVEKESPRKAPSTNSRSPKKFKLPVSSDSEDDKPLLTKAVLRGSQRCRTLRARKTWNYAKMLESNSDVSNDSNDDNDHHCKKEELREPARRQRRKSDIAVAATSSKGVVPMNRLRRNLQVRQYVERTDSSEEEEEDDDEGVNIRVSVSSRGRIRRLTAKARASVFRD